MEGLEILGGGERLFGDVFQPVISRYLPVFLESGKTAGAVPVDGIGSLPTLRVTVKIGRTILKGRAMPRGVIILERIQPAIGQPVVVPHARRVGHERVRRDKRTNDEIIVAEAVKAYSSIEGWMAYRLGDPVLCTL